MKDLLGNEYRGGLSEQFVLPPFSVLDARQGYWKRRKRAWIKIGINGGAGRVAESTEVKKAGVTYAIGNKDTYDRGKKFKKYEGAAGRETNGASAIRCATGSNDESTGTSIFDPVLCELMYRWFCPPAGRILDPFAGESTKGIVATYLGYRYHGIELRQEQIDANNDQARRVGVRPRWIQGDSDKLGKLLKPKARYDFVWTSPPYFNLEIYSNKGEDGSALAHYDGFMEWYRRIFKQAVRRLRDNRFLAVKVGEIRDERGVYRNFVGDNIACFRDLGLHYYNEIILVTALGSLPIRTSKQFSGARKIGKTHQNILVFYKGDPRAIKENLGELKMAKGGELC